MSLSKANIAGLTSPQQRYEMRSILAGTWPPLKPLPVFKYETSEYRATIDFDKLRGEWVCRKTSFPSNKDQELRGELREITLALPHDSAEVLMEDTEEPGQELEKDTNRRLQAIRDWRENYENGACYFELRNYVSGSQRTEMDNSLRLSLTARQLQFNAKNVASVFDAISTAGGRFATLIEFARRNRAKQETAQAQAEGVVPEAERAQDHDQKPKDGNGFVRDQEAAEGCTDPGVLPAVSVKSVFTEQYPASFAERMADPAPEQFEIEAAEIGEAETSSLLEDAPKEMRRSAAFATDLAVQIQTSQSSADRSEGSRLLPVLEISGFHVAVFASVFLFAIIAFAVWLAMGLGPFGSRLGEIPKSMVTFGTKPPTLPDSANQVPPRISAPPAPGSDTPTSTKRLEGPAPSEEKSGENVPTLDHFREALAADPPSTLTTESKPFVRPVHSPEAAGPVRAAPKGPTPSSLNSTLNPAPRPPRHSTALVHIPGRGSQSFRVSFPEKTITATPSLAVSSQLSVFISPESRLASAHKPSRLEAGDLVSFVSPRYTGNGYASTQVIRVRATIGPLGQVRDVKFLSGSASLLPATIRAIRQWRYTPTLLDKRPVQAQQDFTIEFRPAQKSSQVSTGHPSQKLVAVR